MQLELTHNYTHIPKRSSLQYCPCVRQHIKLQDAGTIIKLQDAGIVDYY